VILAGKQKISAANISPGSCRESRRGSHQEAKIPAAKVSPRSYCEILAGNQLLGGQNLAGMLPQILRGSSCSAAKIKVQSCQESRGRKQNFWRDSSWQNFSLIASNDFGDINRLLNKGKFS